jgi:hypothetical protein
MRQCVAVLKRVIRMALSYGFASNELFLKISKAIVCAARWNFEEAKDPADFKAAVVALLESICLRRQVAHSFLMMGSSTLNMYLRLFPVGIDKGNLESVLHKRTFDDDGMTERKSRVFDGIRP